MIPVSPTTTPSQTAHALCARRAEGVLAGISCRRSRLCRLYTVAASPGVGAGQRIVGDPAGLRRALRIARLVCPRARGVARRRAARAAQGAEHLGSGDARPGTDRAALAGEIRRDIASRYAAIAIPAARRRRPGWRSSLTWPGVQALLAHRVAHSAARRLGVPACCRGRSAMLIARTHDRRGDPSRCPRSAPGLFVDHGMGVVIGETAEIGDGCDACIRG